MARGPTLCFILCAFMFFVFKYLTCDGSLSANEEPRPKGGAHYLKESITGSER